MPNDFDSCPKCSYAIDHRSNSCSNPQCSDHRQVSSITGSATQSQPRDQTMDLLYVEWEDSAVSSGWQEFEDLDNECLTCFSVGWLQEETHSWIRICASIACDPPQGNGVIVIPKSALTKRVVLREKVE